MSDPLVAFPSPPGASPGGLLFFPLIHSSVHFTTSNLFLIRIFSNTFNPLSLNSSQITLRHPLFLPLHFSPLVQGKTSTNNKLVPMKMKTGHSKVKLYTHARAHKCAHTSGRPLAFQKHLEAPMESEQKSRLSQLPFRPAFPQIAGVQINIKPPTLFHFIFFFIPSQYYSQGFSSPPKLCPA